MTILRMGDDGGRLPGGRPLSWAEIDVLVRESLRLEKDLDRLDRERLEDILETTPYRVATLPRRRRRSGSTVWAAAPAVVAVLVLCVVAGLAVRSSRPVAGPDLAAGTTAPRTFTDGSYAFLGTQPGDADVPVGYNPCRRIPVDVNFRDAPADFVDLLESTLATLSQVSGLRLAYGGATTRTRTASPGTGRIVVSFDDERSDPALGEHGGIGGSTWSSYTAGSTTYLNGGFVTLNTRYFTPMSRQARSVLLSHELGHAVGLDNAEGDEIMNAGSSMYRRSAWGHGDLTGLAKLGALPCR